QSLHEKSLALRSDALSLTGKLIEFSLTPKEWEKYKNLARGPLTLDDRLDLVPFEDFYREADIRSDLMIKNLTSHNEEGNKVLITGGFHTPQVARLLKNQKISYVVISPKITKIEGTSGSDYLSLFTRDKASLD